MVLTLVGKLDNTGAAELEHTLLLLLTGGSVALDFAGIGVCDELRIPRSDGRVEAAKRQTRTIRFGPDEPAGAPIFRHRGAGHGIQNRSRPRSDAGQLISRVPGLSRSRPASLGKAPQA